MSIPNPRKVCLKERRIKQHKKRRARACPMRLFYAILGAGGAIMLLTTSLLDATIDTVAILTLISLIIYLLPAIIIASAIKKSTAKDSYNAHVIADALRELTPKDSVPVFLPLVEELTYYFDLGDGVFVPKRYYNLEENYYDTPVGAFVPVYEEDNKTIMGFLYKK